MKDLHASLWWNSNIPQHLEDSCHFPNSSNLVLDDLLSSSDIFWVIHCVGREGEVRGGEGRGGEGRDNVLVEFACDM